METKKLLLQIRPHGQGKSPKTWELTEVNMHYIRLYLSFFKMDIRRVAMYRLNLLIGNFGYLLDSIATIFSVMMILNVSNTIGGWSAYEIIFLFGFMLAAMSIWEFFFVTTLEIPLLILEGELDVFLVRPINPLFQFIIFELDEEAIFEMIFSLGLLIFSIIMLGIPLGFFFWLKLFIFLISSVIAIEAIYLAICSICFWMVSNNGLMQIIWEFYKMGQYPLTIYPTIFKVLLTIIPFGFIGFYPTYVILNGTNYPLYMTFGVALAGPFFLVMVYCFVWKRGLKRYTGAGS